MPTNGMSIEVTAKIEEPKMTTKLKKEVIDGIQTLEHGAFVEGYSKGFERAGELKDEELAKARGEGVLLVWDFLNERIDEKFCDGENELGKSYAIDPEEFVRTVIDILNQCPFEALGLGCQCEDEDEEEDAEDGTMHVSVLHIAEDK